MLTKPEIISLACKMIDSLGPGAADKMDAVVAAHVEEDDQDGAEFWGEVAQTMRRLEEAAARGVRRPQMVRLN